MTQRNFVFSLCHEISKLARHTHPAWPSRPAQAATGGLLGLERVWSPPSPQGPPPPRVRASSSLLITLNLVLGLPWSKGVEGGCGRQCAHRHGVETPACKSRLCCLPDVWRWQVLTLPVVLCCVAGTGRRVPANPGLVPGTPRTGLLLCSFPGASLPFPAGLEVLAVLEPTSAHTDVTA